jgi:hypothetical protein
VETDDDDALVAEPAVAGGVAGVIVIAGIIVPPVAVGLVVVFSVEADCAVAAEAADCAFVVDSGCA